MARVRPACFAWVTVVLIAAAHGGAAQVAPGSKHVLVLYGYDPNAPGIVAFTNGLREVVVASEGHDGVELFSELLDFDRFHAPGLATQMVDHLRAKYRGIRLDAIVAAGSHALVFAAGRLDDLFPGVPVVYGVAFEPVVDFERLPAHVTGRRQPLPFAGTLALAKRLQPDAERVILVTGAVPMDSLLYAVAVRDLTPLLGDLELVPLRDWTYPSLLEQLRRLPPRSITILSSFSGDWTGQRFNAGDLIASVSRTASGPLYGIARNWVGDGVVGGSVMGFNDDGRRTGQLLVRVLHRRPGEPLPPGEVADTPLVVDARQLERWGLSERLLPQGTEVLFRTPTLWSRYWHVIVAVLAIIAAQALLIAWMLVEHRQRIRAQLVLEESRAQVAHIARVATLGELAATISHDVSQPLTAIRASAQAVMLLLNRAPPNLHEVREILRDIGRDSGRAAEILDHIRALLRKQDPASAPVDLNLVCTEAIQLLEHDAARRNVALRLSLDSSVPPVIGDAVQLQQVVLNLALNALDAAEAATRNGNDPEVVVGTATRPGTVEVFVRDSGPGLPSETQSRIFEPFFSTKSHGLGMGLAIVRSIVDRHRGKVQAENHGSGGAVFKVLLPIADRRLEPRAPEVGAQRGQPHEARYDA